MVRGRLQELLSELTRSMEVGLRCENSIIDTPEQTTSDMSARGLVN